MSLWWWHVKFNASSKTIKLSLQKTYLYIYNSVSSPLSNSHKYTAYEKALVLYTLSRINGSFIVWVTRICVLSLFIN